jgi:hypothetical protein
MVTPFLFLNLLLACCMQDGGGVKAGDGRLDSKHSPGIIHEIRAGAFSDQAVVARSAGEMIRIKDDRLAMCVPVVDQKGARMDCTQIAIEGSARVGECEILEGGGRAISIVSGNRDVDLLPNVPTATKIKISSVAAGVDLVVRMEHASVEYDLVVGDARALGKVIFRWDGIDSLSIDSEGFLVARAGSEEYRQSMPRSWRMSKGRAGEPVVCKFQLLGGNRYGFCVEGGFGEGGIVIDPGLIFGTYLGGQKSDYINDLGIDSAGATFVTGRTSSPNFPTTVGSFDTTLDGPEDGFVTKLAPDGGSLVYSMYLGGIDFDQGRRVKVDATGAAVVGLSTSTTNMPTSASSYQSAPGKMYFARLLLDGSGIQSSTYFASNTGFADMALGQTGDVYIAGTSLQNDIPTTPSAFKSTPPSWGSAFTSVFSSGLGQLVGSTYIGGSISDEGYCVATDDDGSIYTAVLTYSTDFPVTPGAFQTNYKGQSDIAIAKLKKDATTLLRGTYVSSNWTDRPYFLFVDSDQCPILSGDSPGPDFPLVAGDFDTGYYGMNFGFIVKLAPAFDGLLHSFRISNPAYIMGVACSLDPSTGDIIGNSAAKADFPTTPDALVINSGTSYDSVVFRLSPLWKTMTFATLYGGSKSDGATTRVIVDNASCAYLTGNTTSPDLLVTPGAFDTTYNNIPTVNDGFVAKIQIPIVPYGTSVYGTGFDGCNGPHLLRTETSLTKGINSLTFTCSNPPPFSTGLILVNDQQDALGTDVLGLGIPFFVGLQSSQLLGIDIPSTADKTAFVTIPLPDLTPVVGLSFYAQCFWNWAAGPCTPGLYGLSGSQGLMLTVLP